jgi:hypothetical protein
MEWLENIPANERPEKLKKFLRNFEIFILMMIPIELFLFILIFEYFDVSLLWLIVFIEVLVILSLYSIPTLLDRYGLPEYISFSDKGVGWKTRSGKEGLIDYSKIRSVMRTKTKPFTKKIPLKENIYTITYDMKSIFFNPPIPEERDLWMLIPRGLLLNKENTRILLDKLKEIDPDLKNVEISGWDENE